MRYDTLVILNVIKSVQALHYLDFITLPSTILLRSALLCSTLLSILTFQTSQIRFSLLVSIFHLSYIACTLTCIIFSSLYNIILLFLLSFSFWFSSLPHSLSRVLLLLLLPSSLSFTLPPPSLLLIILPFPHLTFVSLFPHLTFLSLFPRLTFVFLLKSRVQLDQWRSSRRLVIFQYQKWCHFTLFYTG